MNSYETMILKGALKSAAQLDIELICYEGGLLEYSPYNAFEYQRNKIYDMINCKNIKGIVIPSSIAHFISAERLEEYHQNMAIPTVSIGTKLNNVTSVYVDNYNGTKRLTEHIIEKHGFKKIAFVRGPETVPEAQDRYRAYRAALEDYKIPFDDGLVVTGDFQQPSGSEAVRRIFDKNKKRPDAFVCANDNMAIGVINELRRRKIDVPRQIVVTGFDDIDEAEEIDPPLTTERQPLMKLREHAVEILFEKISGKEVPLADCLETDLIIRRSCGFQVL